MGDKKGEEVTCLCLTYGRFQHLRNSLACFLAQDSGLGRLLIWNFHDIPIRMTKKYKNVELLNRPHTMDNIDGWTAALDMVKTPLVRLWADDDLYLPWAISQVAKNIGDHPAYTPRGRYHYRRDYGGLAHYFEDLSDGAALTYRTDVARAYGIDNKDVLRVPPDTKVTADIPFWVLTVSDYDGESRKAHAIRDADRKERDRIWRSRQLDTGSGIPLTPGDVRPHFEILKKFCPELPGELAKHGF